MTGSISHWVAGLALAGLAAPPSVPAPAGQQQLARGPGRGLCRRPAPLAALPREETTKPIDYQRYEDSARGRGSYGEMSVVPPPPPPSPPPPPPSIAPPPMAAPAPVAPGRDVVVTGSRVGSSRSAEVADAAGYGRGSSPTYRPQSGILTAGEHDDLLNPELYARYVRSSDLGQTLPDLPRVDTESAITIQVTDADARPMPLATVTVTCADGNTIELATLADGTVALFPGLDRLGSSVQVSVTRGGRMVAAPRAVAIPATPGPQRIAITASGQAQAPNRFDLLLVVDTTGSMGDELSYLQSEVRTILARLRDGHPGLDIRLGLVFYRDLGDDYVTRSFQFTANDTLVQTSLAAQSAGGGGDMPEAVDQALNRAIHFAWRPDAVHSMLWIADAPPHDERVGASWQAAENARFQRIQIVPVAASGVDARAEYFMRATAAATQSRYLFLTDDSGVGNPHAPPEVDCYLVTRLDQLVRRVLDSQISGRRIEPEQGEVIRTVGQYDHGRCIVPPPGAERK